MVARLERLISTKKKIRILNLIAILKEVYCVYEKGRASLFPLDRSVFAPLCLSALE